MTWESRDLRDFVIGLAVSAGLGIVFALALIGIAGGLKYVIGH